MLYLIYEHDAISSTEAAKWRIFFNFFNPSRANPTQLSRKTESPRPSPLRDLPLWRDSCLEQNWIIQILNSVDPCGAFVAMEQASQFNHIYVGA